MKTTAKKTLLFFLAFLMVFQVAQPTLAVFAQDEGGYFDSGTETDLPLWAEDELGFNAPETSDFTYQGLC